jgi:glycosyltransferase involved in cell wall biosynthesis
VGIDWIRKGGAFAVEVVGEMRRRGVNASLGVVGCTPAEREFPGFVKVIGRVDKDTEEGRERLGRLFESSHFLVLPTLAECCPVVAAEASASGLPSAATNVGGMATVVEDEVTGRLFPVSASVRVWADWLCCTYTNKVAYNRMCEAAWMLALKRLNWRVAGGRVMQILEEQTR